MRFVAWSNTSDWHEYIVATALQRLSSTKWLVRYRESRRGNLYSLQEIIVICDHAWIEVL